MSQSKDLKTEDTLFIGENDSKYGNNSYPKDCFDLMRSGTNISGMYQIKPSRYHKPFFVVCDMDTLGGGWTVSVFCFIVHCKAIRALSLK